MYEKAKIKIDDSYNDYNKIDEIRKVLNKNKVKCFKYNYSLD